MHAPRIGCAIRNGPAAPSPLAPRAARPSSRFATPRYAFTPSAETGATLFLVTLVPGASAGGAVARNAASARASQDWVPKWRRWSMANVRWLAAALVRDPSLGLVNGPTVRVR